MKTLTIFTPAYNRAYCLDRCYKALKRQTNKDFDWLIIDDGSTDNTRELVQSWIDKQDNGFEIRYIYKENGGLHTAYNEAIANMDTELSMCIDSDDFPPDDAVEKIIKFWNENGSYKYAGIVALDYDLEGNIIGDPLPNQKTVNLIDLLIGKYNLHNGDRKNVIRTELYKKVAPMKFFEGEKNFNPHYMHLLISKDYDFLVMNENLCFVEYQPDGMTNSMFKQYYNSPNSFAEIRKLYLSFEGTPFKFKLKHSIHYVSSSILGRRKGFFKEVNNKGILLIALPFGVMLAGLTKIKGSK